MNLKVTSVENLRNIISFNENVILTDAPAPLGNGENITPADLMASSFASCAMTIMAIRAKENNQNFEGCYGFD